uniref:Minor glycoprotein n=1 Tax=Kibale red colobus virus 2 TaxID=1936072 RepID=X2D6D6_9NIDO|nr:minor glycoprotein [Kibale red colobus virus 2]
MEDHHVYRAALCSWLLCFLFRSVLGNHTVICFPVPHDYIVVSVNNTLKTCSAFGWNPYPQSVGVCGHEKPMKFNIGNLPGTKSSNFTSVEAIKFQLHTNFDPLLLVYGLFQLERYPSLFNLTRAILFITNTSVCLGKYNETAELGDQGSGEEPNDTTNQNVQWPTLREFTYAFSSPLFAPAVLLALPLLLVQL